MGVVAETTIAALVGRLNPNAAYLDGRGTCAISLGTKTG